MLNSLSLLVSAALAVVAIAAPIVQPRGASRPPTMSMPMAVHFNISTLPLPEIDRQRATTLVNSWNAAKNVQHHSKAEVDKRTFAVPLSSQSIQYVANVGVGTPATSYTLLVDTASSNTWLGADKKYESTSSSKATGHDVNINYGSGRLTGSEYVDTLSLSSDLIIESQSIGVASKIDGFGNIDGILGLGPVDLSHHTVTGEETVPTVMDNLLAQHKISSEVFSLAFNPSTSSSQPQAELIFGGTDSSTSKDNGVITYTPVTTIEPSSAFWGINAAVAYGVSELKLFKSTAGIVDSASTLILLATSAFNHYQTVVGAHIDDNTGLLTVSEEQFSLMKSVFFEVEGVSFELTPNAQIWPQSLNERIGGDEGKIYLVIADLGMEGAGLDFVMGYTFLQRFFSVFDTTNKRVGFATTPNTMAMSN